MVISASVGGQVSRLQGGQVSSLQSEVSSAVVAGALVGTNTSGSSISGMFSSVVSSNSTPEPGSSMKGTSSVTLSALVHSTGLAGVGQSSMHSTGSGIKGGLKKVQALTLKNKNRSFTFFQPSSVVTSTTT